MRMGRACLWETWILEDFLSKAGGSCEKISVRSKKYISFVAPEDTLSIELNWVLLIHSWVYYFKYNLILCLWSKRKSPGKLPYVKNNQEVSFIIKRENTIRISFSKKERKLKLVFFNTFPINRHIWAFILHYENCGAFPEENLVLLQTGIEYTLISCTEEKK